MKNYLVESYLKIEKFTKALCFSLFLPQSRILRTTQIMYIPSQANFFFFLSVQVYLLVFFMIHSSYRIFLSHFKLNPKTCHGNKFRLYILDFLSSPEEKKKPSRLLTRNQKAFNKVNIFVFFLFPQNCFMHINQSARNKQASCIVWIMEGQGQVRRKRGIRMKGGRDWKIGFRAKRIDQSLHLSISYIRVI